MDGWTMSILRQKTLYLACFFVLLLPVGSRAQELTETAEPELNGPHVLREKNGEVIYK